jgi:hypothetical protein
MKNIPGENRDTFFLFHRPRKWNPKTGYGWVMNARGESYQI